MNLISLQKSNLLLQPNKIHIWHTYINKQLKNIDFYQNLLSLQEKEKIHNIYLKENKKKYIITHGVLRYILSLYVDINPSEINFFYNIHSKPYLDIEQNKNSINFNLSHSDNIVIYAIVKNDELGVDIEKIRSNINIDKLAKRYFSQKELTLFENISENKKVKTFFSIWTKKESYLKAKSLGISSPLCEIDVSSNLIKNNNDENDLWKFESLKINSKYVATLAIQNKDYSIEYFHFR